MIGGTKTRSDNYIIRKERALFITSEYFSKAETHLIDYNIIDIPSYCLLCNNRKSIRRQARNGPWGDVFLVKSDVYDDFHIKVTDSTYDCILMICLTFFNPVTCYTHKFFFFALFTHL